MDNSQSKPPIDPPVNADPPQDASHGKDKEAKSDPPIRSEVPPTPKRKANPTQCRPDQTPWWKWVIEVAAILVGILVASIYYGQLGQMIEQNNISRKNLTSVQRAALFQSTTEFSRIENDKGDKGFIFKFNWENSGATQTKTMTIHSSWKYWPNGLPDNFTFPDLWVEGAPHINTPAVIGPHGKAGIAVGPVNAILVDAVQRKQLHMFFWGWARYKDLFFPDSPEHLSEYCVELTGFTGKPKEAVETGVPSFDNCPIHNCYDDQCSDYKEKLKEPE